MTPPLISGKVVPSRMDCGRMSSAANAHLNVAMEPALPSAGITVSNANPRDADVHLVKDQGDDAR